MLCGRRADAAAVCPRIILHDQETLEPELPQTLVFGVAAALPAAAQQNFIILVNLFSQFLRLNVIEFSKLRGPLIGDPGLTDFIEGKQSAADPQMPCGLRKGIPMLHAQPLETAVFTLRFCRRFRQSISCLRRGVTQA